MYLHVFTGLHGGECTVVEVDDNVSEEYTTSIFRVNLYSDPEDGGSMFEPSSVNVFFV
jgi:hypothetical protein